MKIKYFLERKALKTTDLRKVYCYITGLQKYHRLIIPTDIHLNPANWNPKTQRLFATGKQRAFNADAINSKLDSIKLRLERVYSEFTRDQVAENILEVEDKLKQAVAIQDINSKSSFFDKYDQFILLHRHEYATGTLAKFLQIKKILLEFEKLNGKIKFNSFTEQWGAELKDYLINTRNQQNNTVSKFISTFSIVLNWMRTQGLIKNTVYKSYNFKEVQNEIITLSFEELDEFETIKLIPRLDRVRHLFLISAYTGLRYSDTQRLTWNNIDLKEQTLEYIPQKTKNSTSEKIIVPLIDKAIGIFEKYVDEDRPAPKITNQKFNEFLKEITVQMKTLQKEITIRRMQGSKELIEVKPKYQLISSHTARKSFISIALLKGLSERLVKVLSGHKTEESFRKYIQFAKKDVNDLVRSKLNEPKIFPMLVEKDGTTDQ